MGYSKEQLLALLKEHQIEFACYNHPVVLTVEAQAKYVGHLGGGISKNLFLKDKKHRFYVISALSGTNVDLKVLSQRLGLGKGGLRMAPEEALQEILQVPLGCVTPFALVNKSARMLDQDFNRSYDLIFDSRTRIRGSTIQGNLTKPRFVSFEQGQYFAAVRASDLDKFLASIGRKPSYVDFQATPVVGKDQPPDLASLVPSEVPNLPDPVEAAPAQRPAEKHVSMDKKPTKAAEANVRPKKLNGAMKKANSIIDPLAEATDVRMFVEEVISKTTAEVLSQVNKHSNDQQQELESSVLDGVRKHITTDLENLTMSLKNAAYTQGFLSRQPMTQ